MSKPQAAGVSKRQAVIAFTLGTLFFGYAFVQRVSPSVKAMTAWRLLTPAA
jgi:hypothetical protein